MGATCCIGLRFGVAFLFGAGSFFGAASLFGVASLIGFRSFFGVVFRLKMASFLIGSTLGVVFLAELCLAEAFAATFVF